MARWHYLWVSAWPDLAQFCSTLLATAGLNTGKLFSTPLDSIGLYSTLTGDKNIPRTIDRRTASDDEPTRLQSSEAAGSSGGGVRDYHQLNCTAEKNLLVRRHAYLMKKCRTLPRRASLESRI